MERFAAKCSLPTAEFRTHQTEKPAWAHKNATSQLTDRYATTMCGNEHRRGACSTEGFILPGKHRNVWYD